MTSKRISVIVAIPVLCLTLAQCGFFRALFGPDLAPVVGTKDYSMSSYELQKTSLYVERGLGVLPAGTYSLTVAYADFDLDGDEDIFYPVRDGDKDTRTDVVLLLNNGQNDFESRPDYFEGTVPAGMEPNKAIVGDYNGDGRPDVFVADARHPEEIYNLLICSTESGLAHVVIPEAPLGNTWAAASADIDGDNDLDILATDYPSYFLINDGDGHFVYDSSRVPGIELGPSAVELIDIDGDGYYDILSGGSDYSGQPTKIHWGTGDGYYADVPSLVLPAMEAFEVIIDLDCEDLDGDGDRDIIVTRTGGRPENFYVGYGLQYLRNEGGRAFSDVSESRLLDNQEPEDSAIRVTRLQDIDGDGDIDCFCDDKGRRLVWLNDGTGVLEKLRL